MTATKWTTKKIDYLKENYIQGIPAMMDYFKLSRPTIQRKLRELNLHLTFRHDYVSDFFPITPKSAYTLGFFTGDGCVVSDGGKIRVINISIVTSDAIQLMDTFMFTPWSITKRPTQGNWNEITTFSIHNKEIAQLFTILGLREKSKKFPIHLINLIPTEYLHLYWLGFFDADGHINITQRRKCGNIAGKCGFSASYEFDWLYLEQMLKSLKIIPKIYRYKNDIRGSSKLIICRDSNINILYKYFYQNYEKYKLGLVRKKEKIDLFVTELSDRKHYHL